MLLTTCIPNTQNLLIQFLLSLTEYFDQQLHAVSNTASTQDIHHIIMYVAIGPVGIEGDLTALTADVLWVVPLRCMAIEDVMATLKVTKSGMATS